jgi:tRNA threonylcarbamoyl adenosine modification protein (Sua5/YciO/YrdC/YwlC family)
MKTKVLKASTVDEIARVSREAAAAVQAGKLVGFATETVYGIAALATNADTMARLRELKNRPERPFSIHIGKPQDVFLYVTRDHVSEPARRLIDKAMPGPITLLLPVDAKSSGPVLKDKSLFERLVAVKGQAPFSGNPQSSGVIGIRCPDQPLAREMLSAIDGPVVAPSANLAGQPSPRTASDVLESLEGKIDLLIDSGPTRYGKDSTIIDFSVEPWKIVREGVYDARTIRRFLVRTYLFICTGNTCRSPMAAGVAREMLAARAGVPAARLSQHGIHVMSAGIYASDGAPATPEAVFAAGELDADISHHRSQKLTTLLIHDADMVFCMTDFHVEQVLAMEPNARDKVVRLSEEGEIADPIGGGRGIYRRTARQIQAALRQRLDKGLL